ncbi:chemotaxis protein CheV [Geobacter sulfurreducens]|jgi:two-component system chemotaxis response regulator CheV|uniref:Response receiver scaffold protein CheV n=1 Tax=Geobacter sulfurreducens (strain ATCC 51573 / DSM 12127 / PCA) TaxID=243231 RepID=Q74ET0_GEOSL|nr:chemotaxis protein [Geobacter sulfurreducens]AAR34209.1 response receiver scaffold protein CheV [Geobacter sulfurreducens PCA]ADI83722.1 response receiver scaffold protein CheV [Geobacter sulfurreducens KN400]AJY70617.1 chemotaxis protein CheV [Geobacter sulfurreducens]QVW36122.1 chemotaxis protein CheV [Geobacter sulfurreducens]UAC04935.1 chemotaxis protein [Geobacter sulfurreducens]
MAEPRILLESGTNELEIVEFMIDETGPNGETVHSYFGVNVAKVREIIRKPQMWKVFNANSAVSGMMKLRDKVITVVNLATVLGKEYSALAPDRVVVLEFNRMMVGVLVNGVSRIYRISWEQVEPPVRAIESAYVTGVVKMEDRIILILDFEKIVGELCSEETLRALSEEQLLPGPVLDRSQRRILVADDSAFIRNSICSSLRGAGYNVDEAENGEDAWNMIQDKLTRCRAAGVNLRSELDLLITDVEMPKMDGLHLTTLVKKDDVLKDLPVLIFSSLASDDNKRKWKDLGALDIVTKPDLPNLVKIADSVMH